jgi:hypothetical protein
LRVRRLEEEVVWAARFDDATQVVSTIQAVSDAKLPLWSISFTNPRMSALKNRLPPKLEHGRPNEHEHSPTLPETYIVIFVAPASRRSAVEPQLLTLAKEHGATFLSDELARHEWGERFNLLQVKRLGPSLVPA